MLQEDGMNMNYAWFTNWNE